MNSKAVEILLVEDDDDDASLTIMALKRKNLVNNLIRLNDGVQAIDFVFSQGAFAGRPADEFPRVILLDLKMPKLSGIDVLRRIKSDDRTKHIPVVVLTSSKENPDLAICYQLGANSYIVKPVVFEDFLSAIAELGFYWLVLNEPKL
jgi:Response regulators consisting of a CheY-like receiver domain and a winged-helix DNA-binding domain